MNLCATLSEAFLTWLVDLGKLERADALWLLEAQRVGTPQIGKIAMLGGILKVRQVFRVLHAQSDTGLRFGEQAVALGYLDESEVGRLLGLQARARPSVCALMIKLAVATEPQVQEWRQDFMDAANEAVRL